MEVDIKKDQKYQRAKKRVAQMKGFYIHLFVYILVNLFILVNIYLGHAAEDGSFWSWEHFTVLVFWGAGLGLHAARVFVSRSILGPEWEERQIQKYMERDEEESKKFR